MKKVRGTMEDKNWCSIVVVFKNNEGEEKRESLAGIESAIIYVQNVILPHNWEFISMERGFDYRGK